MSGDEPNMETTGMQNTEIRMTDESAGANDPKMKKTKEKTEGISRPDQIPLPSSASQIFTVFKLQMRLFSKNRSTFILLFLAVLIPILAFSGVAKTIVDAIFGVPPSTSYLLALLPLMIVLIPSMIAGRTLSSEFRNRTAYMNFPLPVTRITYFVGKFLASYVLSLGIILLAFGLAVYSGDVLYDPSYPLDITGAFLICVFGTFAITATAFGLGPFFKRGSMGANTALMLFLPFILMVVFEVLIKASAGTMEIVRMIPPFTSYQVLFLIDHGFGGAMLGDMIKMIIGEGSSILACAGMAVMWGILFLALGLSRVVKKEL